MMKKLTLDIHALRVESFEPAVAQGARTGTVRGNGASEGPGEPISYEGGGCSGEESCDVTLCATCYCPHTGPQPTCIPCSWAVCFTDEPLEC